MALGLSQFLSRDQRPNLFIAFYCRLFDEMPNDCTIFRELKVDISFFLINFKLIINVIFGAKIVWIVAWKYLKFPIFSKYFDIIWVLFDDLVKTSDLFSIFIDGTCIYVQLIDVLTRGRLSSEVEEIDSIPTNVIWKTVIKCFHKPIKLIMILINVIGHHSNITIDRFFN